MKMNSNSKNLCKLFETVFHNILYINQVYVKSSFECFNLLNTPIWQCIHPGVCKYFYNFLSTAEEHLSKGTPLKIVFELKKCPDIILDEYVFHVHPKQIEMDSFELERNIVDIVQSLEAVTLEEGVQTLKSNEEFTYSLKICEEDSNIQLPIIDPNSSVVFVNSHEEEGPRIFAIKRNIKDKENET
ncbi:uncharacterized protein [Parasteatoda tepidariorum]|uniref:uncharacterized protein isoform X1 n=1 Tax=Parasteatoda tepidariorum TaxID=114398 RepID=UPI001C717FB3|nr:uncharacterized protein LOC107442685 isoform X1 [Parasteatoda tepidariorum]